MDVRNLTCIGCPLGCALRVEMENGEVLSVSGNTCKRGDDYARKEVTHPTRIVTSTVAVTGGDIAMVSVKTQNDIPKEKIMDIMKSIEDIKVEAPVHIGDVIVANAADTGVNIIATKDIKKVG
ncbi:MAG: DUF1667 domain-containing protein [Lachnospiraceae bacterium]|jgi:Uncharacterized protein with conserved CXXC pairs|uniref:DUF1667 domain-containing protein n=1 Tax=Roseburia sp. 1XD42-69 TaxID=2320088 RepID=UPI000EA1B402|nr:DUF1667 domain-containing protein [Roseburia sp. 1XD42-69]MCI8875097.1 DUF1667 domain-containing protein [Lachnospiraceae bacterium]MCX4319619.1 DUF1667 domain-containing protein [Lachnospiraceae bacterium]RKJ62734.1 DUF1667 domain-containing protein [Roseburia sp. 1XD42-69]